MDVLPSEDTLQPRSKRSRSSSTSKARACNARKRRVRLDYEEKNSPTDSFGLLTDSHKQQMEPPSVKARQSLEPSSRGRGRGRGRGRRKMDDRVQPLEPASLEHRDVKKTLDIAVPADVSDEFGSAGGIERRGRENVRRRRGRCRSARNLHDSGLDAGGNCKPLSTDSGVEKLSGEKNAGQEITVDADELPQEVNNPRTPKVESSGKLQRSDCDTKLPKLSKEPREKVARCDKVKSTKQPPRLVEEKKPPPKVGFVIPKKKPQAQDALSKSCQLSTVLKTNSAINSLPRIPRIKKILSDEDKERSVLAKLEKVSDRKADSGWDMKCVRPSAVSGKIPENFADHHGSPAPPPPQDCPKDLNWQRTGINRFRFQSLNPSGNDRFPSGPSSFSSSSLMPMKPPVVTVQPCTPAVNSTCHYRAQQAVSSRTGIVRAQLEFHNRQTYANAPHPQPGSRPQEQHCLSTVGSNIPGDLIISQRHVCY